jgi:hypothetical protein
MKSSAQGAIERSVGVKRQAIQEFINELSAVEDEKFVMGDFDCGTAACLLGWYRRFYMTNDEITMGSSCEHAARRFGVYPSEMRSLMTMYMPTREMKPNPMGIFDRLPPAARKQCAIRVLELLMETGTAQWPVALTDVLTPEQLKDFIYHEVA